MVRKKRSRFARLAAVVMTAALVLVVSMPVFAAPTGGDCGDSLTWSLENGTLTITGTGPMEDYTVADPAPWSAYIDRITALVVGDGVTSVGRLALFEYTSLRSVSLADTVVSVGDYAFDSCTALELVHLGNVQTLGQNVFANCTAITTLRLPDTLQTIGDQAFYRCENLVSIMVPASVTELGMGVFGYCHSLVQADIRADITELPGLLFYGCSELKNLSLPATIETVGNRVFENCVDLNSAAYSGSQQGSQVIQQAIQDGANGVEPEIKPAPEVPTGQTTTSTTVGSSTQDTIEVVDKQVTENENATVTGSTTTIITPSTGEKQEDPLVEVEATVENPAGWSDVIQQIQQYLPNENDVKTPYEDVQVEVQLKGEPTVDKGTLEELAGQDVTLKIQTSQGAVWNIDCRTQEEKDLAAKQDFLVTIQKEENPAKGLVELIGNAYCFRVTFANRNCAATVSLPLGSQYALANATLYQKPLIGGYSRLQTVVVDKNGMATFRLGNLESTTKYYVALNVQGQQINQTKDYIIPETLYNSYGIEKAPAGATLTDGDNNYYVVTGTKSSLGISLTEVMLYLAAFMVVCLIVVGVVMSVLNNRKLQKMYASGQMYPEYADDDDDE